MGLFLLMTDWWHWWHLEIFKLSSTIYAVISSLVTA